MAQGAVGAALPLPTPPPASLVLTQALVLPPAGRAGRVAFRADAVEAEVVKGTWHLPQAGDIVRRPSGSNLVWRALTSDANGWFSDAALRGGYAALSYDAPSNQVLLLHAAGHSMAYVNGEPRAGDVYEYDSVILPVALHAGKNELLFAAGRGRLRVRLETPRQPVFLSMNDNTLPDLVRDQVNDTWGAVMLMNTTTSVLSGFKLTSSGPGMKKSTTIVPDVLPLSCRKIGFRLQHSGRATTNQVAVTLELAGAVKGEKAISDRATLRIPLKKATDTRKETFVSQIDGSVQYYGLTPARPPSADQPARALVLSTHGASVEGIGQAAAYAPKSWAYVVAPTNRRPYGFDWEDWGRMDALEVLELAQKKFNTDPELTYLTGHSMGGHGSWYLGATYPDRFAAIAPSAGWISWFSYGGGRRETNASPVSELLRRAMNPVDTLLLSSNYLHQGVYVLHGDKDDNVPVSEAREMKRVLEGFHRDFQYHEQPGAGHWWGNACVDWPPIFDLFSHHRIPDDNQTRSIQFTTANPGVSGRCHWVSVEAQIHPLVPSVIQIDWDSNARRFVGRTENISRLAIDVGHVKPGTPVSVSLDGQTALSVALPTQGEPVLWFARQNGNWSPTLPPALTQKGSHRNGPFKEGFQHRMLFVYGTRGTAAENQWAFAKARFDAEAYWYRGNGSIDVIPDTALDLRATLDRGVVLYGNADNNAAWPLLLKDSPIQVGRGRVKVSGRELTGDDLACLFVRPKAGSDVACVMAVSGTGVSGMRLNDRVAYFMAGVALPDCTVFGPDCLSAGPDGVRCAGYFGVDWSVEAGDFAWRD